MIYLMMGLKINWVKIRCGGRANQKSISFRSNQLKFFSTNKIIFNHWGNDDFIVWWFDLKIGWKSDGGMKRGG